MLICVCVGTSPWDLPAFVAMYAYYAKSGILKADLSFFVLFFLFVIFVCMCVYGCTGWFGVSHYGRGHPGLPEVGVRPAQRSQRSLGNCLTGETFPT